VGCAGRIVDITTLGIATRLILLAAAQDEDMLVPGVEPLGIAPAFRIAYQEDAVTVPIGEQPSEQASVAAIP